MRTITECVGDIKSILNNIERTEHYDGETSVDIDELVNEILSINGTKDEVLEPIRNDKCTCPKCGTYNEIVAKRRNTVLSDVVYCWHCGQALAVNQLNFSGGME